MGSKVIIDGKEYTERTVESLQINGTTVTNNLIQASSFDNNHTIEVNINTGEEIRASVSTEEIKVQSIEQNKIQENKEEEPKTLIRRFIEFIKNIFKN